MRMLIAIVPVFVATAVICYLVISQPTAQVQAGSELGTSTAVIPEPNTVTTLDMAGIKLQLQQPHSAPKVDKQDAINAATKTLLAQGDEIVTTPSASYWLATDPKNTIATSNNGQHMQQRPVWLLTFDRVNAAREGGPAGSNLPSHIQSKERVLVDANTGVVLWTYAQSLGPVATPEGK